MSSVTLTRTLLGLGTLDISATPYRLGADDQEIELGTVTFRKDWARSPVVAGAQLVGTVKDLVEGCPFDVDVTGATQTAIQTSVATLLAAFSQFSYTMTAVIDGATWAWKCGPADYRVGFTERLTLYGLTCPVRLVFDRQPTPVTGPY